MSKRKYVYAESFGMVYRFSPRKWRQMLGEVLRGCTVAYTDFGESVCVVDHSISDIEEMAQSLLNEMGPEYADSKANKVSK